MKEACADSRKGHAARAQAGQSLCMSETIFPQPSGNNTKLACPGAGEGGVPGRTRGRKMLGGEFVDLRGLDGVAFEVTRTAFGRL